MEPQNSIVFVNGFVDNVLHAGGDQIMSVDIDNQMMPVTQFPQLIYQSDGGAQPPLFIDPVTWKVLNAGTLLTLRPEGSILEELREEPAIPQVPMINRPHLRDHIYARKRKDPATTSVPKVRKRVRKEERVLVPKKRPETPVLTHVNELRDITKVNIIRKSVSSGGTTSPNPLKLQSVTKIQYPNHNTTTTLNADLVDMSRISSVTVMPSNPVQVGISESSSELGLASAIRLITSNVGTSPSTIYSTNSTEASAVPISRLVKSHEDVDVGLHQSTESVLLGDLNMILKPPDGNGSTNLTIQGASNNADDATTASVIPSLIQSTSAADVVPLSQSIRGDGEIIYMISPTSDNLALIPQILQNVGDSTSTVLIAR